MNKYIKNKKTNKINYKKLFSKQELLMMRKWNRLSPYYRICGLANDMLQRAYNKVKNHTNITEFQLAIKYTIEALKHDIKPNYGTLGAEYWFIARYSGMLKYLKSIKLS